MVLVIVSLALWPTVMTMSTATRSN